MAVATSALSMPRGHTAERGDDMEGTAAWCPRLPLWFPASRSVFFPSPWNPGQEKTASEQGRIRSQACTKLQAVSMGFLTTSPISGPFEIDFFL